MRVALVADTHLPAAGPHLQPWVADVLRDADHVLHAGDIITPRAHGRLRSLAGGRFTAVRGNRDRGLSLPPVATIDAGDVRFVVTHGDEFGRGGRYRQGLADLAAANDADVAVGGHTHRVLDDTVDGVRVLNPGSATGVAPARAPTLLTVDCERGGLSVTTHRGD